MLCFRVVRQQTISGPNAEQDTWRYWASYLNHQSLHKPLRFLKKSFTFGLWVAYSKRWHHKYDVAAQKFQYVNSYPPSAYASMNRVSIGSDNGLSPIRHQAINKPMLGCCEYDAWEQTYVKFQSKYKTFHARKCISKYRLRNGGHFSQG